MAETNDQHTTPPERSQMGCPPPPPDFTTAMRRAELDAIRNAWGCKPVQHINEEDLEALAPAARDEALTLARGVISQAMRGPSAS